MNIQIIQGQFDASDSLDIITQMIQVKIRYHENMINQSLQAEDIKYRESKIKRLQDELLEYRNSMRSHHGPVTLHAIIQTDV